MKKVLVVILSVILGTFMLFGCNENRPENEILIYVPDGAAAVSLAYMMANKDKIGDYDIKYKVIHPSLIAASVGQGDVDMIVMPSNAALNLYKHEGVVNYQMAAAVTHGNLFLVGSGITDLSELSGKVVGCFGENLIPDMVFKYILQQSGLEVTFGNSPVAGEVALQYFANGTAAYNYMSASETMNLVVLAEPDASKAVELIDEAEILFNLQEVWSEMTSDAQITMEGYPQAVLMVKKDLDKDFVNEFLSLVDDSWAENNADAVVATIQAHVEQGSQSTITSLTKAQIQGCGAWIKTQGLKAYVENCFVKLGLNKPADDFYF